MANKILTNYMPKRIISGGQTGVDRGTLDACLNKEFNCGGFCPKGRRAEDGRIDSKYPLMETNDSDYDTRTRYNVKFSDGTLIMSPPELKGGTLLTWQIANQLNKPLLGITPNLKTIYPLKDKTMKWLITENINILNVAGPRASEWHEGYELSFQLIALLIETIKKSD